MLLNQYRVTVTFKDGRTSIHKMQSKTRKQAVQDLWNILANLDVQIDSLQAERVISTSKGTYVVQHVAGI